MAANKKDTELKRDAIKYVRDRAKHAYNKQDSCEICGTKEELEFHHYYSLTLLWENWLNHNAISITTIEDVNHYRELFIAEHQKELYEDAVTLCLTHHQKLHSIYGAKPALFTAPKQANWVKIQRGKYGN